MMPVATKTVVADHSILRFGLLFLLTISLLACGQAKTTDTQHELTQLPTDSWPTNGGDLYNRRFSPLAEINRENVDQVKGVWRVRLGSGAGPNNSGEAQPIVVDGIAYIITGADDVFAIDIETGNILWKYTANLDPEMTTVCCGWTSRGIGIGEGRVYVGQLDGKLVALDQKTGVVLWEVQAERWQEGFSITSAPLYFEGLVISGFAGAEQGIRGRVKAFNAEDGSLAWTFYTIPGPEEFGHDTWPQGNEIWKDGGASVWHTPAVDPELGLLYFSTGNPGPDFNGSIRSGDNLFTDSIMALDVKTGEYRWHFQQVHHDLWDYDASNPVILFDLEYEGQMRKALAQAGKTGWVYILDRITGEPLIGIEEKPVPQEPRQATAATQPYPVGDSFVPQSVSIAPEGYELVNEGRIFTPFWSDQPVLYAPGLAGGASWPPSSYDPNTGHFFVCASNRPFAGLAEELTDARPPEGETFIGGTLGGGFPFSPIGIFAAVDMRTNKLVWQQHWNDACISGATATAGGLVFTGKNDGRLTALDTSNGMRLWEFQTGAGMNSTVSIFEHKGTQYVLAYAAGNLLAPSKHGDNVWLFSLEGTLDQVPANEEELAFPKVSMAEGEPNLVEGAKVFNATCSGCHGEDGTGGHFGGASLVASNDSAAVVTILNEGRNNMPALAAALSSEQMRDVIGYITVEIAVE